MKDFFANDGTFMTYLKRIGLAIVFNFVYVLTSVPILTIGISNVALFQVMMELVQDRKSESSYLMVYFSAFTDNFVKGLVWGILQVLVTVVAGFDLLFFVANVQKDATPINIASLILTILLIVALVSFFNTLYMTMMHYAGGFKEEFKNTIYIVKNNKKNILFGGLWTILCIGGVFASLLYRTFPWGIFSWMIIMVFGLNGLILAYIYNKIFSLYDEEDEEEVLETEEGLTK